MFKKKSSSDKITSAADWQLGILTPVEQSSQKEFVPPSGKLLVVAVVLLLIVVGGIVRLVQLQVIQGKFYSVLAANNRIVVRNLPYERGLIYSKDGVVLAQNKPTFQVAIVFSQIPREKDVVDDVWKEEMVSVFELEEGHLDEVLSQSARQPFVETVLSSGYSQEKYLTYQSRLESLQGVYMRPDFIREYPNGKNFSHLIGYTGEITQDELSQLSFSNYFVGEQVGRVGIEETFQTVLRGKVGKEVYESDSRGKSVRSVSTVDAQSGLSAYLSIGADLQNEATRIVEEAIGKYKAKAGMVAIQNIQTGELLALVSLPSYDNNLFAEGIDYKTYDKLLNDPQRPLINRAVAGTYPPGSTVKPFVGLAALDEGIITAQTRISDIPQVIEIGGGRFPDWRVSWGRGPVGPMTVMDAIAESSNIFFYKIAGGYEDIKGMGIDTIKYHLQQFNIANKTGIDLNTEVSGVFPDSAWKLATKNEQWYLGDDYQVGIGQGDLLVTPLQMVNATTAIANKGRLLRPLLVDKLVDSDGNIVEDYQAEVIRELPYKDSDFEIIQKGMRQAVADGIIFPLRQATVPVAAKTGTAEYGQIDEEGIYETHAWVEGFAPYDNPEISFVVMLEKGGSSSNAAEVAKDVLNWYFANKQ
ncbi:penicillin-binding protein 2 [candidate division WWE3 bacterium]|uniref:Penicillin-binding protein 2 n=1 Tax=candidate division WWE3 bacterium TaxID=2053526 RepID=A0A955LVH7_UNCKA|nr:penicillin-binding protein 2 [candidate division WWE3 bacterium]